MINQQIIYEEIIEKELSIEEFLEYLKSHTDKKPEELDQKFLKQKIKSFQRYQEQKNLQEGDEVVALDEESEQKSISENSLQPSTIFLEQGKQDHVFTLNNQKVMKKTDFFKTKGVCTEIESGNQIKKRMSLSFAMQRDFVVVTYPFGWRVNRELRDFVSLQESLQSLCPFIVVPVIEEKRLTFISKFPNEFHTQ